MLVVWRRWRDACCIECGREESCDKNKRGNNNNAYGSENWTKAASVGKEQHAEHSRDSTVVEHRKYKENFKGGLQPAAGNRSTTHMLAKRTRISIVWNRNIFENEQSMPYSNRVINLQKFLD